MIERKASYFGSQSHQNTIFCGRSAFELLREHYSILYGSRFKVQLGSEDVWFVLSPELGERALVTVEPRLVNILKDLDSKFKSMEKVAVHEKD